MDLRQRQDLDRYITGNYGEDQFNDEFPDTAHAQFLVDTSVVYRYDSADDGPEVEIIRLVSGINWR